MNYIGIDPGKSGGIAIIREDGSVSVAPFCKPEYRSLLFTLDGDTSNTVACIERVHAFSGQGVTSCFSFGENFGWVQGLLFAYGITTHFVIPQIWKKHYGLIFGKGTEKSIIKNESIKKARSIFLNVSLRKTSRCKTDDDGMAEALLIANYAKEIRLKP